MSLLRPDSDPAVALGQLATWLDEAEPARLLIETSGSTGRPKRVVLSRDAVLASARASAARLGGEGRWALALPSSYVAGVQVIVRSLLAGHAPVLGADLPGALAVGARFVSLVPTQLRRALDVPDERAALTAYDTVLLGGGPIDPALRQEAEGAGVRVVATYGASETAGGCVYDGLPLDGVDVRIDEGGRIALAGPMLFEEYDGDRALTAETLVDGWFLTSDAGRLEDGRLTVLGRLDDVVVSGGVNVPGPAVAARLRAHPDVTAAEVVGVDDPEWGRAVVAIVVGSLGLEAARDWVAEDLPRAWAPRRLLVVPALPLLAHGKVDRQALLALAEAGSAHG